MTEKLTQTEKALDNHKTRLGLNIPEDMSLKTLILDLQHILNPDLSEGRQEKLLIK